MEHTYRWMHYTAVLSFGPSMRHDRKMRVALMPYGSKGRDASPLAGVITEDREVRGVAAARQARLHRVQLPVQPRRCTADVISK